MKLDLEAKGVERTRAAIINVGKRGNDVRPVYQDVKTTVRESNRERFDTRGQGTWPALKDSTRAAKRRRGQDKGILRASDALYRALTAPRAKGQVNRKKADMFKIGTSIYYARFHDQGDGGMPKRTLIDLQEDDMRDINRTLEVFIAKGERDIQSML